jgi:hypothetical protein
MKDRSAPSLADRTEVMAVARYSPEWDWPTVPGADTLFPAAHTDTHRRLDV